MADARNPAPPPAAARVSSVSISIDGMRATHDAQRGVEGSFDRAVLAMTHLREAGVPFSANSQVNRLSFADLGAMLELFIEHGCHGWQIAMTVPMGRATERPEWLLQPHDLPIVFDELARLAVRGREGGVILYPGNNVGYFGPHEDTLRGHLSKETEGSYYQGCSAGRAGLGLEADGSVKGCPSLPSAPYTGGNVRRTSIREIWETTTELSFARGERSAELWGFCAGCYYASVCKAGCSWTAHVYFGRRGNNPICHHRALEHQKRGEREVLRRIEDAPGLPFDYGRWTIDKTPAPPTTEPWPVPPLERPKRRLRVV